MTVIYSLSFLNRYGFVTFENQDDVVKLLQDVSKLENNLEVLKIRLFMRQTFQSDVALFVLLKANGVSFNDKKLIVDQAFRKQRTSGE